MYYLLFSETPKITQGAEEENNRTEQKDDSAHTNTHTRTKRKTKTKQRRKHNRQELTTKLVTDDIEVSHSNIIGSLMEVASRHIPRSTPPSGKTTRRSSRTGLTSALATSGNAMRPASGCSGHGLWSMLRNTGVSRELPRKQSRMPRRRLGESTAPGSGLNDRTKIGQVWGMLRKMS